MRPSLAASYIGWEESSKVLDDAVKRLRPDGILGRKISIALDA